MAAIKTLGKKLLRPTKFGKKLGRPSKFGKKVLRAVHTTTQILNTGTQLATAAAPLIRAGAQFAANSTSSY